MAPPLTIGLTGGIAAGKSEALAAFGRLGAATLSSDAVVHDLLGRRDRCAGSLAERWGARGSALGRGAPNRSAGASARSSSPIPRN